MAAIKIFGNPSREENSVANIVIQGSNNYEMHISNGGVATNTTINNQGLVVVSSGGKADKVTVNSDGIFNVSKGGSASDVTLNAGGSLRVFGKVSNLTWTPCVGDLRLYSGAEVSFSVSYNGIYYGENDVQLENSVSISNRTITGQHASMYVMQNGIADKINITGGADLYVFDGGKTAETEVNGNGNLQIYSGGSADSVVIGSGGSMYVAAGGTATNVNWTPCIGSFGMADGAHVTFVSQYSGVYFSPDKTNVTSAQTISDKVLEKDNVMYVMSNGKAENITLAAGSLYVMAGGSASIAYNPFKNNAITSFAAGAAISYLEADAGVYYGQNNSFVSKYKGTAADINIGKGGKMIIYDTGSANRIAVASSGTIHMSGGKLTSASVDADGKLYVSNGAVSSVNVAEDGNVYIYNGTVNQLKVSGGTVRLSGGKINNATINDGVVNVSGAIQTVTVNSKGTLNVNSNGTAADVSLAGGRMNIGKTGSANNISILRKGELTVSSGAYAADINVSSAGALTVAKGGVAENIELAAYSELEINSTGVVQGTLNIANGAVVEADAGAVINFTVNNRTASSDYIINNLGAIQGSPSYTITVSASQAEGTYKLAKGAAAFNGSMTVTNGNQNYGTISVNGNALVKNGMNYVLKKDGSGNLTLLITGNYVPEKDTEAPKLSGTPNASVNNQSVTISWSAASDNVGVAGYKLTVDGNVYDVKNTSHTLNNLTAGNHTYSLQAYDAAGNMSSASSNRTFTIAEPVTEDTEAPKLSGTPNASVNNQSVTISWSAASDNIGVAGYKLTVDGNVYDVKNTSHTLNNLATGNHTYSLQAYDAAGNMSSASSNRTFTIAEPVTEDTEAPKLSGTPNASVNNQSVTISWTAASDNVGVAGYKLTVDGNVYDVKNTSYTLNNLTAGNHTYSLQAYDAAGNMSGASSNRTFTIAEPVTEDTEAPKLSGTPNASVNNQSVTISWSAASDNVGVAGYKLTVDGNVYDVKNTSHTLNNLTAGNHTYSLQAYDAAGNMSSASSNRTFTIAEPVTEDTEAPKLSGTPNASVNNQSVTISWSAASDNVGVAGYKLTVDGNVYDVKNTSYTLNNLTAGNHTYSLQAYDAAGNMSGTFAEQTFTVEENADTVAPEIKNVSIRQGNNGYTFTVSVSASDDVSAVNKLSYQVRYAFSAADMENGTVIDGKTFALSANDAGKTVYYQISVSDEAGNAVWSDVGSQYIKDVTAPTLDGAISVSVDKGNASIVWDAAADNTGIKEYIITVNNEQRTVQGTSQIFENLANGVYNYSIVAVDFAGIHSAAVTGSFEVSYVAQGAPNSPKVTVENREYLSNLPVSVKVEGDNDSEFEYSFDKSQWFKFDEDTVFTENGTVYFRAVRNNKYSKEIQTEIHGIDMVADSAADDFIFVKSSYSPRDNGKKQNGIELEYGVNAFNSLNRIENADGKKIIMLDSKVKLTGDLSESFDCIGATAVMPTVKGEYGSKSYSYKASASAKGSLDIAFADIKDVDIERFATVVLRSNSEAGLIFGGKEASAETIKKSVKKDITSIDNTKSSSRTASGKITIENSSADKIFNFAKVTVDDGKIGSLVNENYSVSDKRKIVDGNEENVTVTKKYSAAGSLSLLDDSEASSIKGFKTVKIEDSTVKGSVELGASYTEKYTLKPIKISGMTGYLTSTVTTYSRVGSFTAVETAVSGNVTGFATVKLTDSKVGGDIIISDVASNENGTDKIKLTGSLTMLESSAGNIRNYAKITLTDSSAACAENVQKVTVSKGVNKLESYIGTAGNDVFTINKNAVLHLGNADFGGGNDKFVNNGVLILTSAFDINAEKISGKGEIGATTAVWNQLENQNEVLNLGATAENFRGTAYENGDDTYKKAVKWDTDEAYCGWFGSWNDGQDTVDHIKFKAEKGDLLNVTGVSEWELLDKKGNVVDAVFADGEYIIKLIHSGDESVSYGIELLS